MLDYLSQRTSLIQRLLIVQQEIAQDTAPFTLFAMFEREEATGKWDVVIAAPWIGRDIMPFLKRLAPKINHYLTAEEVRTISRIEVLQPTDDFVTEVLTYLQAQNYTHPLYLELNDIRFYNIDFRRGYVFQWNEQPQAMPSEVRLSKRKK